MNAIRRRVRRSERGAFLIIFALCLTVLVLVVALVIDLGFTRADRRGGQLEVDNAAATAAQTFADSASAEAACEDAYAIVAVGLDIPSFTGQDCSTLPVVCNDPTTLPVSTEGTFDGDRYTLTVTHPVGDDTRLMDFTSTISNAGIDSSADDGAPCERIGVQLTTTGPPFFGGVAGSSGRTSTVHAVGRISAGNTEERPLNLLALERYRCDVFVVSGQGDVNVASSLNDEGVRRPGIAAIDSNGTLDCQGQKATLETSGQGDLIANGPCPAAPALECVGEGRISLMAPFANGTCVGTGDTPGCREGANGEITPNVEVSPGRFTRAPLDYRFNCKASYASEPWYSGILQQDIPGCPNFTADTDYIDELKAYISAISSMNAVTRALPANGQWLTIGGNNPNQCTFENITFVGNVFVNCSNFRADANVVFAGGNVIFRDDVTVQNGSGLTLHEPCPAAIPATPPGMVCTPGVAWSTGQNFSEGQSSTNAAWISVGGQVSMNGGRVDGQYATLLFPNSSGRLNITGGDFTWEAPLDVGPFDDLAMWSEGTGEHSLGGNGGIDLVGTLFTGQATFNYAGGTAQVMDEAQFIANRLRFTGQGALTMSPAADRNVDFPIEPLFNLIR